jgi:hypothetical protein
MLRASSVVPAVSLATAADVPAIAALHESIAQDLTRRHGRGHWSSVPTERAILRGLETSTVLVARRMSEIVGTVRVAAKKPWAIDVRYFAPVPKAVYLQALAVATTPTIILPAPAGSISSAASAMPARSPTGACPSPTSSSCSKRGGSPCVSAASSPRQVAFLAPGSGTLTG